MFKGVYTAASGMLAAERVQQLLSHNLANAQTPGYKADRAHIRAFPEMLLQRLEAQRGRAGASGAAGGAGRYSIGRVPTPIGSIHTGVYTQEAVPFFAQGPLQETGRALDLALVDQNLPANPETGQEGRLFWAVLNEEEEVRYTRNGQFTIDADGYLVTAEGHLVLDVELNPIYVGDDRFTVAEDGTLFLHPDQLAALPDGAEPIPRLFVGYTEQPYGLVREGNGLWRWEGGEDEEAPFGPPQLIDTLPFLNDPAQGPVYAVRQGFVEQSNVDLNQTMTQMLIQYRLYEANQRVLQSYDRSMDLAANQIGRLI